MQPLFPPWSDTVLRLGLSVFAASAVVVPVATILWARTPYATKEGLQLQQPVAFDHRHHVRDDGINCVYCHSEASRSKVAGIPPTSVCMGCHGQVWQESTRLAPVRESWLSGQPLRWRRVHQLPDFVYFDHSAHVSHGVGCAECHGRVDQMAVVYAVAPLTMEWCLDCHRDPDPHLRPPDEITSMDYEPPEPRRAQGAALRSRLGVDPPVSCTGCHR